jgi:hypothetical protein
VARSLAKLKEGVRRARLIGANVSGDREKDDFYATPTRSTEALLRAEQFEGAVWEPACGDGAIAKVLSAAGHEVVATDLVDRGYGQPGVDFLMEHRALAPNIITNPPFKLANDFARNALRLTVGKVALLLKVGFLEGKGRHDLYDTAPFARLWVFRERQTFLKGGSAPVTMNGGGGMIAYGWFIWDHAHKGAPTLGWL